MLNRFFCEHPRSVGESYFQHFQTACGFGGVMILAGAACFIHALIPGLFGRTGSAAIERLHERMVVNRRRHSVTPVKTAQVSPPKAADALNSTASAQSSALVR